MKRRHRARLGFGLAALAALATVAGGVALAVGFTQPDRPATRAPAGTPATVAELRVTDLMRRAGCDGQVIGTQLYSKETGRCTLAGAEVTIAVFDTDALRDQWVDFARQYGGNLVTGAGWAAGAGNPDAAVAVARRLGGQRA